MPTRIWPDTDFDTGDTGFWQWLKDWANDFLGHKASPHPAGLGDLDDVDETTGPSDADGLGWDGGDAKWKPQTAFAPLAHGSTHAPDGTDPVDGLEFVPVTIDYDEDADAWPLRATVTDNTDRVAIWLCRIPGKDKPVGAGLSVPGKDVVLMADAP